MSPRTGPWWVSPVSIGVVVGFELDADRAVGVLEVGDGGSCAEVAPLPDAGVAEVAGVGLVAVGLNDALRHLAADAAVGPEGRVGADGREGGERGARADVDRPLQRRRAAARPARRSRSGRGSRRTWPAARPAPTRGCGTGCSPTTLSPATWPVGACGKSQAPRSAGSVRGRNRTRSHGRSNSAGSRSVCFDADAGSPAPLASAAASPAARCAATTAPLTCTSASPGARDWTRSTASRAFHRPLIASHDPSVTAAAPGRSQRIVTARLRGSGAAAASAARPRTRSIRASVVHAPVSSSKHARRRVSGPSAAVASS